MEVTVTKGRLPITYIDEDEQLVYLEQKNGDKITIPLRANAIGNAMKEDFFSGYEVIADYYCAYWTERSQKPMKREEIIAFRRGKLVL